MRTSRKGVVHRVKKKVVVTVGTIDTAHPRRIGHGCVGEGSRGGQADHPFAIWPWASNALAGSFTNEKAIARTSHVFPASRSIPDGRGFVAARTFDNVLVALPGYVNHGLTNTTGHHGRSSADGVKSG